MSQCFKIEGNLPLLTVSLKNYTIIIQLYKNYIITNIHTKKIAFFFITFTGMSVRCAAFGGFNCVISLYISLKLISDK